MKKRLLAMLMAGAMVAGLAGCGEPAADPNAGTPADGASAEGQPADSAKDYNISVILKTTSAEYWQFVQAGCEEFAKEHEGVKVEVKGPPSETSYDEQLNMIQTDLGNESFDGYIISPLQSDMVANTIKGESRPVIALDTEVVAPEIRAFVGTGNEEAAKMGGKAAVEAAKAAGWEEIKCIEIAGVQGDATNTARMDGYRAGVNEAGGEFLDNEVQYADAVADRAVSAMEGIMSKFPEGIAIICANNDDMAMAAAKAAATNENYKNTIFLGFNGDKSACESILAGSLTMSVAQQAYNMGYKAVEAMVKAIDGEQLDAFIDSGADVITAENAQARIDELAGYLA